MERFLRPPSMRAESRTLEQRRITEPNPRCGPEDRISTIGAVHDGRTFNQVNLAPVLGQVLQAETWQQREAHLTAAYEHVARMHNALGLTADLDPGVSPFYGRPFLVLHAERFAEALHAQIQDPEVRALPKYLGGIDQFVDSTDVLSSPPQAGKVKRLYG